MQENKHAATHALLAVALTFMLIVGVLIYTTLTSRWLFPMHQNLKESPQSADGTIAMSAYYWGFSPSTITVKKGDTVRLEITNVNNMMPMMSYRFPNHGIDIEGYGIEQVLPAGETITIEFIADKAGEFHFHCSIYCGMGHENMHGELIVEE